MSIDLAEQLKHADGKDCRCCAYAYTECACGCDWTPSEVYELRAALAAEQARAERAEAALREWDNWNYEVRSASVNGESIYSFADLKGMREKAEGLTALALRPSGDGVQS